MIRKDMKYTKEKFPAGRADGLKDTSLEGIPGRNHKNRNRIGRSRTALFAVLSAAALMGAAPASAYGSEIVYVQAQSASGSWIQDAAGY